MDKKRFLLLVLSDSLDALATTNFELDGEHYVLQIGKESWSQTESSGMSERPIVVQAVGMNQSEYGIMSALNAYVERYNRKDVRMVRAMANHFRNFTDNQELNIHQLTPSYCLSFLHYLEERLHGNSPANYYKKFKGFITTLHQDGIIHNNPTQYIRLHYTNFRMKHALSYSEIMALEKSYCENNEVKRAFLFSCFSGLRWCDVQKLKWTDVDIEKCKLQIMQKKVEGHSSSALLSLYLGKTAMRMIGAKGGKSELVFDLPSYSITYKILQRWKVSSGLGHPLSFHCARHTFITNLISHNIDIKTVARLAGHSTTKHTERYIHEIDENLRHGAESLDDYEQLK